MVLAKALYAIPTRTRLVELVADHPGLRSMLGCPERDDVPSHWACYRFALKLRGLSGLLADTLNRVVVVLHEHHPDVG